MKKNKVIYIAIFIIFIILIMVLLTSIVLIKSMIKKNEENPETKESIESIDSIEEMQEGGIEYNENQLNNFTINIQGLTSEIEEKISNKEQFNLKFKEYIYINGLVDAENAILDKWQFKDDILYIRFKLDDIKETNLIVKVEEDNIEVNEYNI